MLCMKKNVDDKKKKLYFECYVMLCMKKNVDNKKKKKIILNVMLCMKNKNCW